MIKKLAVLCLLLPLTAGCSPYWYDSQGDAVRDSQGECVRTGSWLQSDRDDVCNIGATIGLAAQKAIIDESPVRFIVSEDQPSVHVIHLPGVGENKVPIAEIKPQSLSIFFDLNSDKIKPEYFHELSNIKNGTHIIINGYTDQYGTNDYNLGLSLRRANAVRNYLWLRGANINDIEVAGYGKDKVSTDRK